MPVGVLALFVDDVGWLHQTTIAVSLRAVATAKTQARITQTVYARRALKHIRRSVVNHSSAQSAATAAVRTSLCLMTYRSVIRVKTKAVLVITSERACLVASGKP